MLAVRGERSLVLSRLRQLVQAPTQARERDRDACDDGRRVQADDDVRQIPQDDGLVDPEPELACDRDGRLERTAQPVNGLKFAFDVICQRVPFQV